jgi:hypothetical protein
MSKLQHLLGIAFFVLLAFSVNATQTDNSFTTLLDEAGLNFQLPDASHSIDVETNELFPYEYAVRKDNKSMEIRYSIRPLSRIEIDYEDPHSSAPEPNHIFTMMFTALIGQLSSGGSSPHREYKLEQAQTKFNADWAGLSVFDLESGYSMNYKQAFLVALHKNNLSDAYMVILFNDYDEIKATLDQAMQSLRFKTVTAE